MSGCLTRQSGSASAEPEDKRRAAADPAHAARNRRSRVRERQGIIWLGIEVPEHAFAQALIASERVTEAEALDRKCLIAAVEQLVADFIERWPSVDTRDASLSKTPRVGASSKP
jgi:hypothetical protein